jgi:hypothetical protein
MIDDPNAAAARIARRAAARLAGEVDPDLPEQVERALAEDPLGRAPERALDPVSLGSLIVSLVALGWTIHRDLKRDREAAQADRAAQAERLAARLREEGAEAARLPAWVTPGQRVLAIAVIAEEIVAADEPTWQP